VEVGFGHFSLITGIQHVKFEYEYRQRLSKRSEMLSIGGLRRVKYRRSARCVGTGIGIGTELGAAKIRQTVQGASVGLVPVRGQQLAATIDYNTTILNTSFPISVSGLSRRDQRLGL
jgi:hypothetical protein